MTQLLILLLLGVNPQDAAPRPPSRSLAGIVEDSSGGAVAGALVTVTCADATRKTTTDAVGQFIVEDLPAAQCSVEASGELLRANRVDIDLTHRSSGFARLVLALADLTSEVTVTPARGEQERTFDVPDAVSIATREELETRPLQILPQALREETGILVQQTTTAQGSPFIRGFSAQRIVYLLDGVRFNTATFRAGATQFLGWINPSLVQRIEVVRGPTSVQYGSDALGGSVNVLSLRPETVPADTRTGGSVQLFAGSADRSVGGDLLAHIQTPRVALSGGVSTRRVGDLRPGAAKDSHSALTRFLGLSSRELYSRLPDTGFDQSGGHISLMVPIGTTGHVDVLYAHEAQSDVSRYDRIIGGDGLFRSQFDPQRLDFGYVRLQRGTTGPFDAVQATISVNRQQDDRLEQRRPDTDIEREAGRVTALGYQGQGTWLIAGRHGVTVGGEVFDEFIGASRMIEDPRTGRQLRERPEIPDGSRYTSAGVFAQDSVDLLGGRLGLRGGVRAGYFSFRVAEDRSLGVAADSVTTSDVTFQTGAVWRLTEFVNATLAASRGFRAANAYDLGAIGISGGGFEIAPTTAARLGARIGSNDGANALPTDAIVQPLQPESSYAFEAGIKVRTPRLSASVVAFDLELVDVIQRRTAIFPTIVVGETLAGYTVISQDEGGRAFIAEDPRPIVTRVNVDRARIAGIDADVQIRLAPAWLAGGWWSLANGREIDTGNLLRRMPPPMGGLRLKWEPTNRGVWAEATVAFARPQTRLNGGDLGDARIGARRSLDDIAAFFTGTATDLGLVRDNRLVATRETLAAVQARVLGAASQAALFTTTPGFAVLSLRGGLRLTSRLDLTVIADNLTDRNYRWHGSGVDAPGINVQVRTRWRF
ncbi:MAG: TonB-dependent receptor [Luteitalea sp.]|nr:TonB-dependent receptor [Luteitalea sp.]